MHFEETELTGRKGSRNIQQAISCNQSHSINPPACHCVYEGYRYLDVITVCAILCTFSLFTCHVDVIQPLTHQMDAEWREFGTFVHVDPPVMDRIDNDRTNVGTCMLRLVEDWV